MIQWFRSLFTTRQAVLDLTDQVIGLRTELAFVDGVCRELTTRLEKLEQIEKLNARVATQKGQAARNWSAFRSMAEAAENA